jgi:hypothetical protein
VSLTEVVWPVFPIFLLHFWSQIYTTPLFFFQDTRPPIVLPVFVRSSRRKLGPQRLSMSGAWPAHAREPVALWCAWRLRPAFFGRARCWLRSTVVYLQLGGTDDGVCHPRAAVFDGFRFFLYCWQPLFLGFSCFVLCILLVSSGTVCLCITQILLKFLLASNDGFW